MEPREPSEPCGLPRSAGSQRPLDVEGLVACGVVMRRKRRHVGENEIEVIEYTLGPRLIVVEDWEPAGYASIGEVVAWPVVAHLWNNRITYRREKDGTDF